LDSFLQLVASLRASGVRFAVIGVAGANYYAGSGSSIFVTQDRDFLLPLDPDNLLRAWQSCRDSGLNLWAGDEPLCEPLDLDLARRVVERRAATRATDAHGLEIDLSLDMAGFTFEEVWSERRAFLVEGVEIPVARLAHIVQSKAAAGRDKDRLFLATHEERLRALIRGDD
jgi:hypothetical protein